VPGLFDEFDRLAAATAGRPVRGELPPDHDRIFKASLVDPDADQRVEGGRFRPSFRHLALLVQVPGVDVEALVSAEKGAPLDEAERTILAQRVEVARVWLAGFAPDRYRVDVREELPPEAASLDPAQSAFLSVLADAAEAERPASGDAWQDLIYRTAQSRDMASGYAFQALYAAFLGRSNGPRAGWLLASLDPAVVIDRLRAAGGGGAAIPAAGAKP
jgi:lysyl-tRNA synthetase class 1